MIGWNLWNRLPIVMAPWEWGVVIVTIAVAIWLIALLRSHFREDADDAEGSLEMLTQFRELHQQGSLSDDEFRLIRSRLARGVQEACVTGQVNPKVSAVATVQSESMDRQNDEPAQSPHQQATAEKMEKSDGMTDDGME